MSSPMPSNESSAQLDGEGALSLNYHLVAYLDLMGQSQKLLSLERLPVTVAEQKQVIAVLRDTAVVVRRLREQLDTHFAPYSPSEKILETLTDERQLADYRKVVGTNPRYRGFSDSVVITVPLAAEQEVQTAAALNAVNQAFLAAGAVWLNFFATVGVPIRGGVEVGLGVEMFEDEYYGRALVDAYVMESTAADYPRILVGPRLGKYLLALEGGVFTDERLREYVKTTVEHCRQLLVPDPDDGLLAVDPLWPVEDRSDPHHADYVAMAQAAIERSNKLSGEYRKAGRTKLALKYARLNRLLLSSPRAEIVL